MTAPDTGYRFTWRSALLRPGGPPATARLVAVAMAELVHGRHGDGPQRGRLATMSAETLADMTGLSERSVRDQWKVLHRLGWLDQLVQGGVAGGPKTSTWLLTTPESASGVTPERDAVTPEAASAVPVHNPEGDSGVTQPTPERDSATPEPRSDKPCIPKAAAAAAARELVSKRRRRPEISTTKADPAGWLLGALEGIDREIAQLQAEHPDWTAEQLANQLAGPDPTATDTGPHETPDHSQCISCDRHGYIDTPAGILLCDGPHLRTTQPQETTAA